MRSDENGSAVARYRLSKPTFGAFESTLSIPIGSLLNSARQLSTDFHAIWKVDLGIPLQALPEPLRGGYFDITPVNLDRLEVRTTSSPGSIWLLLAIVLPPPAVMLLSVWIASRMKLTAPEESDDHPGVLNPVLISGAVGAFVVFLLTVIFVPKDGVDELGSIWFGGSDSRPMRIAAAVSLFTCVLLGLAVWRYFSGRRHPSEPLVHSARKDLYFVLPLSLSSLFVVAFFGLWVFGDDWVGTKSSWAPIIEILGMMGYFAALSSIFWIGVSGSERAKLNTQMLSQLTADAMGVDKLPVVYGIGAKNEVDVLLGKGAILVTPQAEDNLDEEEMRFAMARCYALSNVPKNLYLWICGPMAVIALSSLFFAALRPAPGETWKVCLTLLLWATSLLVSAFTMRRTSQCWADEHAYRKLGNLDVAQSTIAKLATDSKTAAKRVRHLAEVSLEP